MRKIVMSLFIILITAVTCFYLINDYNTYRDKQLDKAIAYSKLPPREQLDTPPEEDNNASHSNSEEELEEEVDYAEKENQENIDIDDDTDNKDRSVYEDADDSDPVENIILEEETAAVFKINKETIPQKISLKDKAKLVKIVGKLSVMDYGNIVEIMNGYDEMGGATEIFNILKKRLSEKDYQEVKDILYPYMYLENIEENMHDSNVNY
ncbi:hypothetical protein ACPWSR_14265 [Alloiococcus sp. CFN-8]|uniref:hypothetical protein n=1 Tax=Alloiococcus sp. CFN-8 TaxID=3416081 RepID=UPI003CEC3A20